MSDNFIRL